MSAAPRNRGGRPKLAINGSTSPVAVRLPIATYDAVYASERRQSVEPNVSKWIREAIERRLRDEAIARP